ncbi:MAG TPA: hypothetical protein VEJ87_07785 [Acidimicrobiales bacterium]|nr:hypothetical protein [Acidimicrobiales bacterium]
MSTIFTYVPHPRVEERLKKGPPKVAQAAAKVHGSGTIGQINAKVGLKITLIVGTMWCAYIFTIVALLSAPSAFTSHNLTIIIAWISSNFLQLVLLPVIIVGQNIQAKAADDRSQATFEDAVAILEEAKQIQAHLAAQDASIERILAGVSTT